MRGGTTAPKAPGSVGVPGAADKDLAGRYQRFDARLDDLHKRAGALIQPLGVCPLPAGIEIVHTPASERYDWAFCLLERDPVYKSGRLHVPGDVQRRLRHLDQLGVHFDALVIGHEVDKQTARVASSERLKDKLLEGAVLHTAPPRSVAWTNASVAALLGAGRKLGGALAAIADAADPALLGAVTVDGSTTPDTPAALFLLAAWR